METKKIIIPFYLEYLKCVKSAHSDSYPIFIFRNVVGDRFHVTYRNGSIICNVLKSNSREYLLIRGEVKDNEKLKSLGKILLSKSFDDIDLKIYWDSEEYSDRIAKYDKNQLLLTILNCLNMNLSPKNVINDRVTMFWNLAKNIDINRFENPYKDHRKVGIIEQSLWEQGRYFSEEVYKHFKNYRPMKEVNIGKIEGIRDIEDGINFVKLPSRTQKYGADFDLIGLKEGEDGEYTLVNRDVSNSDLNTCRYRTTSYVEKMEYVPLLIDQDTKVTSVLIQWNNKDGSFDNELMDDDYIDVKKEHRGVIEAIISSGLDEEKEKEKEDSSETEEERISREFNVNNLVKIAEGIGKRIDRDRKYITSKDISPILDGLKSTINYLKSIEQKD